jgi:MoxR-like ATPase
VLDVRELDRFREHVRQIFVDRNVLSYAVRLADATRFPAKYGLDDVERQVEYGSSPRGPIGLVQAAQALALLRGRTHVTTRDVRDLAPDVLRHRMVLSYEALADGISPDAILERVMSVVTPESVAGGPERVVPGELPG